jgi:hypothetical protein
MEFDIPGDVVKQLSPNQRLHWAEKNRRTQSWKQRTYLFWVQAGGKPAPGKVRLSFTQYRGTRGRPPDGDNIVSACKGVIDGLVGLNGLVADDGPSYVEIGSATCIRDKQYEANPFLRIHIEILSG